MEIDFDFRRLNAYAMQNGITLGLFGVAALVVFKWSFTDPFLSTLFLVMLLGGPVLTTVLTLQYRKAVLGPSGPFSFFHAFLQANLIGLYASLWVALAIFVYLQYFDHGTIFEAYAKTLEGMYANREMNIETRTLIDELTGGEGPQGLAAKLQAVGAASYAAVAIYMALFFSPLQAAVIALVCRRSR